jgi:bifunctional non-homologous end joining protein LigD
VSAALGFRPVQLATLVDSAPTGDDWLHETKFDGYRCLLVKDGTRVAAYTRYGNDWSERFRAVVEAAAALPTERAVVDGEVVVLGAGGRSDFARLQNAMREDAKLDYYAFDLLAVGDEELAGRPLVERKARLEALLAGLPTGSRLHYSAHRTGGGVEVLRDACQRKLEGIISKWASAPYVGGRSETWLKVKCLARQEFVIAGWTPSQKRSGFASLILGLYDRGALRFAGRVGTGFNRKCIEALAARLLPLERVDQPLSGVPAHIVRSARWVEPRLVAEVEFTEFTRDGVARHPSFIGLREDKPATDISAEYAKHLPARG